MLLTYFYRPKGSPGMPQGAVQVTAAEIDDGTLEAINMLEEMGLDLKTTDIIFAGYYA